MSRGKRLIVLLCVLVVLAAAAVLLMRLNLNGETDEVVSETVFSLDDATVTELTRTYEDETWTFVADEDGNWSYADDAAFPTDGTYLDTMVDVLSDVTASRTMKDAADLSEYGLDEPVCEITVVTDDGNTATLLWGDESGLGEGRYLSLGDETVYVADDILENFSYGLFDLVAKEEIPDMTEVTGFAVDAETQTLELSYLEESGLAYTDSLVWFAAENGAYTALDTDLTEDLTTLITDLVWGDCVAYDAGAEEAAAYGLDSAAVTVTVTYTADDDSTEAFVLEIGDYASDESCYARIAGSEMIYEIDASICDTLLYTAVSDLLPTDILDMDWNTVDQIDIEPEGDAVYSAVHEVTVTENEDGETEEESTWLSDGKEIALADVLDALNALSSTGSEPDIEAERSPLVSFTFCRNTESFQTVELIFYAYDSSNCLVSLNGETRLFASRSGVDDIITAVEECFEPGE